MKKVLISEDQYKRIFLLEQSPLYRNSKSLTKAYSSKNKKLGVPNNDPYGWATYGAPNKETGVYNNLESSVLGYNKWVSWTYGPLSPVSEEVIKMLLDEIDADRKNKGLDQYDDIEVDDNSQGMDPTGAGGQGARIQNKIKFDANRDWDGPTEQQIALSEIVNWNKLVSKEWQEFLIAGNCKDIIHKGCDHHCGDTMEKVLENSQAREFYNEYKNEGGGGFGMGWKYTGGKICGRTIIMPEKYVDQTIMGYKTGKSYWETATKQWCIWKNSTDTVTTWQKDCPGCFNKKSGGLFVYPIGIEGMSEWNVTNKNQSTFTYHCGCVSDLTKKLPGCSGDYWDKYGKITGEHTLRGYNQKLLLHKGKNAPTFFEGLGIWVDTCIDDYHCLLDVASILVLAIPGIGPILSMGLDIANGVAYGVEGYMSDDKMTKYGSYTAGLLTIVGGVSTGYGLSKSLMKIGKAPPKVMKFTDDVLGEIAEKYGKKGIKKADDVIKKEIDDIFIKKMKQHGLTESEVKYSIDLLNDVKKLASDDKMLKSYVDGLRTLEKKFDKVKFQQVFAKKRYQKLLKESDGDILIALEKYSKLPEGKHVLTQLGMFAYLETLLPGIINNYVTEKSLSGDWGPRRLVEALGYNWEVTKQLFGAISKTNEDGSENKEWTKEKSYADNKLLQSAINSGWRPHQLRFTKDGMVTIHMDPNNPPGPIPVPEKYQTELYKQNIKDQEQEFVDAKTQQKVYMDMEKDKIDKETYSAEELEQIKKNKAKQKFTLPIDHPDVVKYWKEEGWI